MLKRFAQRQSRAVEEAFKSRASVFLCSAVAAFILLNAVKLSIFNFYIIPRQTPAVFQYKLRLTLLLVSVLYPLLFNFRSRLFLTVFYGLQALYIMISLSYYMYFHSYLRFSDFFLLFGEGLTAVAHSSAPMSPRLLTAFIDLPFFAVVVYKYPLVRELSVKLRLLKAAVALLCLLELSAIEIENYRLKHSLIHYVRDNYAGETQIVERYGTFIDNLVCLYKNSSETKLMGSLRYGEEITGEEGPGPKPGFVLIQVESLDSNAVDHKYKGRHIAPFLHSMSEESVYFPYVLSYHLGGGTSDAEFSIINSIHPLTGFPAIKMRNYDYHNSFVRRLAAASYETLAFHGNVGNFYNRNVAFPRMGFRNFFDMDKMNLKDVGWGAPDGEVFEFAAVTLKSAERPFFAYIITMTGHGPFTNARNYYDNSLYDDVGNPVVRDFFNTISYVDQVIESFVKDIRESFENTYIFIWGDHSPNINTPEYKQASLVEGGNYLEFVPLIIITPDGRSYRENRRAASFLDFSPTLLNAAGIAYTIKSGGVDLLSASPDGPPIPFKDESLDRYELFRRIESAGK